MQAYLKPQYLSSTAPAIRTFVAGIQAMGCHIHDFQTSKFAKGHREFKQRLRHQERCQTEYQRRGNGLQDCSVHKAIKPTRRDQYCAMFGPGHKQLHSVTISDEYTTQCYVRLHSIVTMYSTVLALRNCKAWMKIAKDRRLQCEYTGTPERKMASKGQRMRWER